MANKVASRSMSLLLAVIMTASCLVSANAAVTPGSTTEQFVNPLADENLSAGVHYTEEDIMNFRNEDGHRLRVNHLVVDPSDPDTKIISAKAMDTVSGRETVLEQADREVLKGNNVIAGVNADSYDIDSSSGINRGIHIQNGCVIQSQPTDTYTTSQPTFYVRKDGTVKIGPLNAAGSIVIGDAEAVTVPLLNRNDFTYAKDVNNTRIFTSNITATHKLTHVSSDKQVPVPTQKGFALVKIDDKDFDYAVEAGRTYTGTVENTYTNDGFTIPEGYIVYAGYGTSAAAVSSIPKGTQITYTCNLYPSEGFSSKSADPAEADNDIESAITSFHLLAKDGVKNDAVMSVGSDDNARTVIGVTDEGIIHVLACNKPSANMTQTAGSSFSDITDYMMEDLGCVDVLNLDGGGSTTMVARRAGSDDLSTVNYPSDGTDRIVGNSLLFVNTAEKSSEVSQVVLGADINVFKNSHFDFSAKLTDANGHKIPTVGHNIEWSAQKGTVDDSGHYQAPDEAGDDTVTATVDGVSGSVNVSVRNVVSSVSLSVTGTLALQKGETRELDLLSYDDETGARIYIDPEFAKWNLSSEDVVTVQDGVISPAAASGQTDLTVEFLDKTVSLHIIVGMKEQIIDDFESDTKIDGYEVGGSQMYHTVGYQYGGRENNGNKDKYIGFETADMPGSRTKDGNSSLRLTYDTNNWPRTGNGTFNLFPFWDGGITSTWTDADRAAMESRYTAKAMPKKFGLWVYSGDENHDGISDNYDCMMTAVFYQREPGVGNPGSEQSSNSVSLKLTPNEHMDWIGWKWVEADIPQDWEMPIVFNYFWISNINRNAPQYQTSLLFDDLKFIYTDEQQDLEGPVFSDTTPKSGPYTKDLIQFSTTVTDAGSGVAPDSIKVTVDGEAFEGNKTFDESTGKLSFAVTGLQDAQNCHVVVTAKDKAGNASTSYVDNTYQIDLKPDAEPPVITDVTPNHYVPVQISRPRVGFNLSDIKSGVDPDSIQVKYGGKDVTDVYFDADTGCGYAQPDWDLTKGTYPLTITAKDQSGNVLNYKDDIEVNPVAQPKDPKNFKIDVIPDTQGNTYSERFVQRMAADDSDFVIHLGDITDEASPAEYEAAKQYETELGKPLFVIPGNHEASQNNLDLYYQNFGSPTYTFTYGDTRFIMLNSAYRQSISTSDSTQYHYLQDILNQNTSPNVYVVNHVITRDHFYTEHNMTAKEAEQFEGILSGYKVKNPNKNVTVLFGHLHTLDNWQVGGVNYIIGGNAAGKGYVTPDEGNMLGNGKITVQNGAASYAFEPFLTAVYIKNDALIGNTIKTFQSSKIQMNLYGDFREYPADYITQLNSHELVNIAWSSANPDIASVDGKGVVTAKGTGTAQITAVSGGKRNTITLNVHNASDAKVTKLEMALPESIKVGQTLIPTIKGTDAYGTVFALDNKEVNFTFKNGLMSAADGTLRALRKGQETVTVQYQGLTAEADITIDTATSSEGGHSNSGDGGATVPSTPSHQTDAGYKSDTTANLTVNGRYQFKITSTNGKPPVFVVGTAGVFDVKLVKTNGTDYYYQVTAIGALGARAGIYVNGSRLLVLTAGTTEANTSFQSDTTAPLSVASGNTYQFKITSKNGQAPKFIVGTSGIFATQLVRSSGKNYYFKLKAIGVSGRQAGIYVNGVKLLIATVAST